MRRPPTHAFTLIEMLVVMLIIAVIAGLIVQVAGYAQRKSALTQTRGEIENMGLALESYKSDNGSFPRLEGTTEGAAASPETSPIDPRTMGNPLATAYKTANLFLYQQLSGDQNKDGNAGDTVSGQTFPVYFSFPQKLLSIKSSSKVVEYIRDPFGNAYGYSTAGSLAEEVYRAEARSAKASTSSAEVGGGRGKQAGYNPTYDLWSTAGETKANVTQLIQNKWVKNW